MDQLQLDPNVLAELFPTDQGTATTPQENSDAQPTQSGDAQTPPTPAVPDERYVGTYKTREAAEQGIAQKDALIEQMRQRIQLATGIDPISQRRVEALSDNRQNYLQDKKRYGNDLRKATTDDQLADIQSQFVMDVISPLAPAITAVTREAAISRTDQEVPGFRQFYGSRDYQTTLDRVPDLKEAIEAAEADIKFHQRLPGLYKVAQLVSQGIQLPELLKAKPNQQTNSPQRTANVSTTPTPPEATTSAPGLNSSSGRQAIIDAFEKANVGKTLPW